MRRPAYAALIMTRPPSRQRFGVAGALVLSSLFVILLSAVVVMSAQQVPPVVNGWREYPLRDGAIAIQPAKWRTDNIKVPVPAGKGLEYKLTMAKGEGLVYNITYGALADPGMRAKLAELGGRTIPGTPADFGKVIAAETAKWEKVVISSGAKVE